MLKQSVQELPHELSMPWTTAGIKSERKISACDLCWWYDIVETGNYIWKQIFIILLHLMNLFSNLIQRGLQGVYEHIQSGCSAVPLSWLINVAIYLSNRATP